MASTVAAAYPNSAASTSAKKRELFVRDKALELFREFAVPFRIIATGEALDFISFALLLAVLFMVRA